MATGAITSTGIGSGLDVSSILDKLMSVEQQPLTRLQEQASSFNTQMSVIGKLQSAFSTMRDKANSLVSPTLWAATSPKVSDETAMRVSTSEGAAAGSYAVQTTRLAASQTVISTALDSSSTVVGAGSLTIELGGYDVDGQWNAKTDTSPVSIDITDPNATLADIRDAINASGAGVTASIVKDASGSRLTLRSTATGEENAFRISASEATDDGDLATGLSALAYDSADAGSPMTRTAEAANAQLLINGIEISSASNTLDDVIDGLTLTLNKVTEAPVTVEVNADTETIKTAVKEFVDAFNSVASFIRTNTAYNESTSTSAALQGDQPTLALQAQLRAVINQGSTASSSFSRLSEIGITMKADGTLELNDTKLSSAMGNLGELKKLMATDGDTTEASGFARRFKQLADAALGTDGMFDSRTASLRARLDRNSKSQDAMELRLESTRERLQRQYSALDTTMASLSTLSSYMSQQIAAMNASS